MSNLSSRAKERKPLTDLTNDLSISNDDDSNYESVNDQIDVLEAQSMSSMNQQQQIRDLVNDIMNNFKKSQKEQKDLLRSFQ